MNSRQSCSICLNPILEADRVEILLQNIDCKTIIGKYRWHHTSYCFGCLKMARKMLWRHFISLLFESDSICAANMLLSLKYYDIPLRLTNNMRVDGLPVFALYYHGEMLSSRLETGLSDMQLERFREKIKNAKEVIKLEMLKGENLKKESHGLVDFVLNDLFQNMKVC
jgi:hypothetical protein